MHTVPLNLGGLEIYLASYSPIETSGLPDGARLIELGDDTAVINRQGGIELLPPRQPEPVLESSATAKPSYQAGIIRTDFAIPLGITATLALIGLAFGTLTGTFGQMARGILSNNTPPVIAAPQSNNGGLEGQVAATPTPQIWTPTPAPTDTPTPTYTPAATATPTPIPDLLGMRPLKGVPITDVHQIQHIIDYLEQALLGRNVVGYSVPVYFLDKSGLKNAAPVAAWKTEIENDITTAFTTYVYPANTRSGQKAEAVYILSGQPFEKAIADFSNEIAKPYIGELNRSSVIVEGGGLIAEVGVYQLLMDASGGSVDIYKPLKSMLSPTRMREEVRFYLTDLRASGDLFVDAYRVAWLTAAKDTGIEGQTMIELMAGRPDGRPTLEETKVMLKYLIAQSGDEMVRRVNAGELRPYSSQVEETAVKRLERDAFTFAIGRENRKIIADYSVRLTAP